MQDSRFIENDFLNKITEIITENLSNDQFGVSELAGEIGMSRSNLLRKIKKLTSLSASQFIRQVRLKNAMEMLRQTSLNVSEVSYQVGFGSTSYFIKCFHDFYGYPPGEAGAREIDQTEGIQNGPSRKKRMTATFGGTIILLLAIALFIIFKPFSSKKVYTEKSIAVLPFKNDSNDSSNVYIINGLMESILNNLQKIEDLRVISRTSVEKYRNADKTIPEIASELDVNYFIEGSGQKIGDKVFLNIQLIDAPKDKHLWAEQYNRETKDIFTLQMEVAKDIADEIQAIITPEEEERLNKIPTDDPVAYDYFLKGQDLFFQGTYDGLEESITWFEMAIEHDYEFAHAYADIALAYFMLDALQVEKQYSVQINSYADKALLFDSKLPQSLMAKAVYYMNTAEHEQALPYLEKALEYNPNSAVVINMLSDFYVSIIPNTVKYLEYSLKGISLDIAAHDSNTASFIYLHVSNALMQTGFVNEAETYINKSLEYNPDNLYSELVRAYVLFAQNRDLQQTKELISDALAKDTTRLDLVQEIGKVYYYMRNYESAYKYYKQFIEIKEAWNLDIFRGENDKIGVVYAEMGLKEESERFLNDFLDLYENDISVYKHLNLAMLYSYKGDTIKAIEQLELFSQEENYDLWVTIFVEIDPLVDNIKDMPEFNKILREIEIKFWKSHKKIKSSLEKQKLL
ncbi:helix-turn-helix domain-containing protein [Bacteroidota bacterium]